MALWLVLRRTLPLSAAVQQRLDRINRIMRERLAGIRTKTAIFGGFLLSGAAVAIGGLILVSQLGAASPNAASGLELSVVTAVILGGASLAGGRGTIVGTLLGVLILGTLNNGLTLMNINSFWQDVARGVLLLAAVGFDQLRLRLTGDK